MQSMKRTRGGMRAWLLAAALAALPLTTHALSIRPEQIFRRDDTCGGDASLAKCTQSGLPGNFCCDAKGSECVVLAGQTTVICCPGGRANCAVIAPIVCDLRLQDAAAHPGAQVKTTVLNGALPQCGNNCCPYGYRCEVDGNCVMNEDQSKRPEGASPAETPVSSSISSPTSEPAASSTAPVSSGATASAAPSSSQPEDPAPGNGASAAIIGGAVAGGLMVLLMAVAAVIVCRRRSKRQEQQSNERAPSALSMRSARNRDTKSFFGCIGKPSTGPPFHISAPIGNVQRSDFNGKGTPSIGSTASVSQASFYRPSQEAAARHDYWNSDGLGVPADGQSHHWARHASAVPAPIRPIRGMNHSGRSSARSSVGSVGHVSASAQHPPRPQPRPESIQVRLDAQQYAAATYGSHPAYGRDDGGAGRHRLAPPPPSSHLAPPSAYDDRRDTTWTDIRDYASGPRD